MGGDLGCHLLPLCSFVFIDSTLYIYGRFMLIAPRVSALHRFPLLSLFKCLLVFLSSVLRNRRGAELPLSISSVLLLFSRSFLILFAV